MSDSDGSTPAQVDIQDANEQRAAYNPADVDAAAAAAHAALDTAMTSLVAPIPKATPSLSDVAALMAHVDQLTVAMRGVLRMLHWLHPHDVKKLLAEISA